MISEVAALLSSPPLSTRCTDNSIEDTPSWPDDDDDSHDDYDEDDNDDDASDVDGEEKIDCDDNDDDEIHYFFPKQSSL